jgi:ferredoxin--NADP+ reductase
MKKLKPTATPERQGERLRKDGARSGVGVKERNGPRAAEAAGRFQRATVVARRDLTADLWVIRLRPEEKLHFTPGQYATLATEVDGRLLDRPFSIASSPHDDEVEFFLEMLPSGGLSPHLHKCQVGDTLLMSCQAKGQFALDLTSGHKRHYLVATVTGVSPFMSIVRTLAHEARQGRPTDCEIVVMHGASRSWELAYAEEFDGLVQQSRWLRYLPTISRPWEDRAWEGEVGRIEDVLRKYLDLLNLNPATTTTYLCGHPQMIQNCKGILKRRGFAREFIREEFYWGPKTEERSTGG